MRILFAPANTASFCSILLTSLNKIENVHSRGLAIGKHPYLPYPKEWLVIDQTSWKKNPLKRFVQNLQAHFHLIRLILWADVIHWIWDIKGLTVFDIHYHLIRFLRKPIVIEWVGSELRVPEIVFKYSRNYERAWKLGEWEYTYESMGASLERQYRFKKLAAIPAVCPEMSIFLNKRIFDHYYSLYVRVDVSLVEPVYPDPSNKVPIVAHTPSAIGAKGTKYVREIISTLKQEGLVFDYIEVTNCTKDKALDAMRNADIFLDHFIYGSYGMASCEALAFGKPVFSFLMEPVVKLLPEDTPIINASLETLKDKLRRFLEDGELRRIYGIKSRKFAEKYHNSDSIAKDILGLYTDMLARNSDGIQRRLTPTVDHFKF